MLAEVFGLEEIPGLTDIILGNYTWTDTVKTITDIIMGRMTMDDVMITPGMDNLNIITSGSIPPNPAELIESERLMTFLEEAKKKYDIVIIDSTPVLSAADAAIIGKKVDGVLIVYRVGAVSRGLLKRTATQLEQVKCNIIGIILNGMKPDISPDFPDYKYYKYYSYYGEQDKKHGHHIKKKLSPFFGGGKEARGSSLGSLISGVGKSVIEYKKREANPFLRWLLLIFAFLFIGAGILWHTGIINATKGEKGPDIVLPVNEKSLNQSTDTVMKSPPPMSNLIEDNVPIIEKEVVNEISVPESDDSLPPSFAVKEILKEPTYEPESFPFSLYFGSFSNKEKAEMAIAQYRRENLSPFYVRIDFKEKGIWYRVYGGYFKEHEEAQRLIKELELTDAEVRNTAYANLIGIYDSIDDLEATRVSLGNLGYSPYTLKDQESRSVLFVGAFVTEEGAEDQNIELQSNGIQNFVVKR
jgi:capsular exopolysaccharide synthesis family protein